MIGLGLGAGLGWRRSGPRALWVLRAAFESLVVSDQSSMTLLRDGPALRVNPDGEYEEIAANLPRWHYIEEA